MAPCCFIAAGRTHVGLAEQRQAAVHVVGQPVFHATGTAATATDAAVAGVATSAAATTATVARGGRRPGRSAEPDQTQVAHAATAGAVDDAATATAAAAAAPPSPTASPSQSTAATAPPAAGQQHDPVHVEERGWRRMERVVVVVLATGHHAGHGQQTVRLWPGAGQPAGRGHAEAVAAAHTGAQGFHAVPLHTATAPYGQW